MLYNVRLLLFFLIMLQMLSCQSNSLKRKTVNVIVETTKGNIEIELYESDAPKTVANFLGLVEQGYYNGVKFHRIAKDFVIQTGDSTGTGYGGRSIYGKPFEDELDSTTPSYKEGYKRGVVAMANYGPNTNTSQFFIVLQNAPWLPKKYTIFGRVIKGMDVVDSIATLEIYPVFSPNDGKPVVDVIIKRITVKR